MDRCRDKVLLTLMCYNYAEWGDLRFSQRCRWGFRSSEMCRCVVRRELPDESKNLNAIMFMVTQSDHALPISLVSSLHFVFCTLLTLSYATFSLQLTHTVPELRCKLGYYYILCHSVRCISRYRNKYIFEAS